MIEDIKTSSGTIIRTAVLIAALINQILTMTGHSILPFDEEAIAEYVSMTLTAAASLLAWWKNNSFTRAAKAADKYMKNERAGR
mgnify:CR=1 FL=1